MVSVLAIFVVFLAALFEVDAKTEAPIPTERVINTVGKYEWVRLFNIDNSSNNALGFKRTEKVTKSILVDVESIKRSAASSTKSDSAKLDIGGVFEIMKVDFSGKIEEEIKSSMESTLTSKNKTEIIVEKTVEYTVEPGKKGVLYQLRFHGAGLSYADEVSTHPNHRPDVQIEIKVREYWFLQNINVIYGENYNDPRPNGVIKVNEGVGNPDINTGYGGKYVYLEPEWTQSGSEAVTSIDIRIQKSWDAEYQDLAAGAGGWYRYLELMRNPSAKRISRVGLVRAKSLQKVRLGMGTHEPYIFGSGGFYSDR